MKTIKVERYEEHTLILEEGIDYIKEDLVPDHFATTLFLLPADKLTQIAKDKGFDKWTFMGHAQKQKENENKDGMTVRFAKLI